MWVFRASIGGLGRGCASAGVRVRGNVASFGIGIGIGATFDRFGYFGILFGEDGAEIQIGLPLGDANNHCGAALAQLMAQIPFKTNSQ